MTRLWSEERASRAGGEPSPVRPTHYDGEPTPVRPIYDEGEPMPVPRRAASGDGPEAPWESYFLDGYLPFLGGDDSDGSDDSREDDVGPDDMGPPKSLRNPPEWAPEPDPERTLRYFLM